MCHLVMIDCPRLSLLPSRTIQTLLLCFRNWEVPLALESMVSVMPLAQVSGLSALHSRQPSVELITPAFLEVLKVRLFPFLTLLAAYAPITVTPIRNKQQDFLVNPAYYGMLMFNLGEPYPPSNHVQLLPVAIQRSTLYQPLPEVTSCNTGSPRTQNPRLLWCSICETPN